MSNKSKNAPALGVAVALAAPICAHAQNFGERAQLLEDRRTAIQERLQQIDPAMLEQRRDAITQRLQSIDAGERAQAIGDARAARMTDRTAAFESLASIDAAAVETRLTEREEQILRRLSEADGAAIASTLNERGAQASDRLADGELQRLTDEQTDNLMAAAARAETISADQVDALIANGALRVDDFFTELDAATIATQLNEIGAKALDAQDSRRAP